MRIRILNTTFGLVVDGIVKPKSPKDPPFEVDEKLRYLQLRPSRNSSRRLTTFSPTRCPMIRRANNGL